MNRWLIKLMLLGLLFISSQLYFSCSIADSKQQSCLDVERDSVVAENTYNYCKDTLTVTLSQFYETISTLDGADSEDFGYRLFVSLKSRNSFHADLSNDLNKKTMPEKNRIVRSIMHIMALDIQDEYDEYDKFISDFPLLSQADSCEFYWRNIIDNK